MNRVVSPLSVLIVAALAALGVTPAQAVPPNRTFLVVDTIADEGEYADVVIGADGDPLIAFYNTTAGNLQVVKCRSRGCNQVGPITTIDSTNDTGYHPSIALRSDGLATISYFDNTVDQAKLAFCADADCTSTSSIFAPAALSGPFSTLTDLILPADTPTLFFSDITVNTFSAYRCGSPTCTTLLITPVREVDSGASVGRAVAAAIGSDGNPVVSYQHGIQSVRVAHCTSSSCASATVNTIEDPASGTVGNSTSVAIGPDGFPLIAYTNQTEGLVKLAYCSDLTCTAAPEIVTLHDSAGTVDEVDILVNALGLPVVSFYETGIGASIVRAAGCEVEDCSVVTVTTLGDGGNIAGSAGGTTSIALGTDGRPVIAYYEDGPAGEGGLWMARCGSDNCNDDALFDDSFENP